MCVSKTCHWVFAKTPPILRSHVMTVNQDAEPDGGPCVFVRSCHCMHLSLSLYMYRYLQKYAHMTHQACHQMMLSEASSKTMNWSPYFGNTEPCPHRKHIIGIMTFSLVYSTLIDACWILWSTTLYEHQHICRYSGTLNLQLLVGPYLCCATKVTCRRWLQCAARCFLEVRWSLFTCSGNIDLHFRGPSQYRLFFTTVTIDLQSDGACLAGSQPLFYVRTWYQPMTAPLTGP